MSEQTDCTRREFLKIAGATAAAAAVVAAAPGFIGEAQATDFNFVGERQDGVYAADANPKIYKLRKSQDNPMVLKLYAKGGFLGDGPCGHRSHELLHTHYVDRSAAIRALKAKGVKLKA